MNSRKYLIPLLAVAAYTTASCGSPVDPNPARGRLIYIPGSRYAAVNFHDIDGVNNARVVDGYGNVVKSWQRDFLGDSVGIVDSFPVPPRNDLRLEVDDGRNVAVFLPSGPGKPLPANEYRRPPNAYMGRK